MLEIANADFKDSKIEYINMSMTDLKLLNQKFDVIYSSLAFYYVEDFPSFATDLFSILNVGGYLLFSQEHPIVTATLDGKGHFNCDKNGDRVSYTFSNYNQPEERKITWFIDGVIKYHRTLGNIITPLAKAGFIIDTVDEPLPEEWALKKLPTLIKEWIKPNFLIVKAKK